MNILTDVPPASAGATVSLAMLQTYDTPPPSEQLPQSEVSAPVGRAPSATPMAVQSMSPQVTKEADIRITMTLTAPTCGMGPIIITEVKRKLVYLPQVDSVAVDVVFDPPWSQERMTSEAKLVLGLM